MITNKRRCFGTEEYSKVSPICSHCKFYKKCGGEDEG